MRVLVIGATGDVGRGVVASCLKRGWTTVAAGRTESTLADLALQHNDPLLSVVTGSLDSEAAAAELADAADLATVGAVVVTVSGPWRPTPVAECGWDTVSEVFDKLLRPHVNAARVLVPRLSPGATYLAIGGGMADAVFPGMAPVSMAQAAQRNLVRAWSKENRDSGVNIRELLIAAMVNGRSTRTAAGPDWLTDIEIGERVTELLAAPDSNPGPVLTFSVKDRAGA
ncbi:oxidoreductase [Nocardia nova]|uniref:Oxidoreductase n=1 Tax=Nocardia nova TaxID=37330 RepID=A0A2S6AQ30_9NOCA|nr:SDR family NAD(P)-dependent oxidoreductase [Nocardia nova]PPJ26581.1 oxidoreductase [Nocardia nova]PPJ37381.1 oxidoreductase [Nocardia nova]